jgi:hypothetical protein
MILELGTGTIINTGHLTVNPITNERFRPFAKNYQ